MRFSTTSALLLLGAATTIAHEIKMTSYTINDADADAKTCGDIDLGTAVGTETTVQVSGDKTPSACQNLHQEAPCAVWQRDSATPSSLGDKGVTLCTVSVYAGSRCSDSKLFSKSSGNSQGVDYTISAAYSTSYPTRGRSKGWGSYDVVCQDEVQGEESSSSSSAAAEDKRAEATPAPAPRAFDA
ncbi:Uu.00g014030.m01.CDS01 [Anthostomella pinea]|uniref:Uu.00g014030.m01.CDS01 n=1 Tax=Anthostomella pinea TaxID=933095 RepID=A0AAI8VY83_9PEZI|nr:Uu.00g014030.m01.CDS01 [Anthostomella pinea]